MVLDKGVKAVVAGHMVKVEGPKGKLELVVPEGYQIEIADSQLLVKRPGDSQDSAPSTGWCASSSPTWRLG